MPWPCSRTAAPAPAAPWTAPAPGTDAGPPSPTSPSPRHSTSQWASSSSGEKCLGNWCLYLCGRAGENIPLHDHPGMHGIIKCLSGQLKITSFTRQDAGSSSRVPDRIRSTEVFIQKEIGLACKGIVPYLIKFKIFQQLGLLTSHNVTNT